jgi:3-oxoacyl-[acyl-carrier protein] reductase
VGPGDGGQPARALPLRARTFFKGVAHYIHYTTSKGGVVGFTRSLARELGEFGIRVKGQTLLVDGGGSVH